MHRKNILFVLSLLLLLVVFCSSPLPKTIRLTQNYLGVKSDLMSLKSFDEKALKLSQYNTSLEKQLNVLKWDSLAFEGALIKKLNFYCDSLNTEIVNLNKAHVNQREQYRLETYQVILRGGFYNTLRVLNHLENELSLCQVIHLEMEKKKKSGRRKPALETHLLLMHIE